MSIHPALDGRLGSERRSTAGTRVAFLWVAAGLLFVIYPALRPYSSESGLAGAAAFASGNWIWAHVAGMVAFGCLAAGCCLLPAPTIVKGSAVLGVGLILPYYGAEAFGLHAIGRSALRYGAAGLADAADAVRYNLFAVLMFTIGWVLLAVVGVALARLLWRRGLRAAAVCIGTGMVLYLPQFFGPPAIRIGHGAILGIGLLLAALGSVRQSRD